ncbi:MAG: hypothetical protein ABIA74_03245 [bacterium]
MFKKLFFIATLFLFTSICANTENQTITDVEFIKNEQFTVNIDSENIETLLKLYANDKWGFVGHEFIDKWKNKNPFLDTDFITFPNIISIPFITLATFFTSLLVSIGLAKTLAIPFNKIIKTKRDTDAIAAIIASIIIPMAIISQFVFHLKLYKKQLNMITKSETERVKLYFKKLLDQWSEYKKIIPEELHPLFEKLIVEIDKLDLENLLRIIQELQYQTIKNHAVFYEKYKQNLYFKVSSRFIYKTT